MHPSRIAIGIAALCLLLSVRAQYRYVIMRASMSRPADVCWSHGKCVCLTPTTTLAPLF
jgi:hypothetical protein